MVNLHDPDLTAQVMLAFVEFWHILAGIYIWEFSTTLNYEWRVFRGRLPYRWTIWIYSLTRVACLMGVITTSVGIDVTTPINCQIWVSFAATFFCISLGAASLLIVLRIFAIWDNKKAVMVVAISLWGIGIAFHVQCIARLRAAWDAAQLRCHLLPTEGGLLDLVPTIFIDLALLPILVIGLVLLRRRGDGSLGLSSLIWKQGVVWFILVFLSEAPEAVMAVMNSNEEFIFILLTPGMITMTIAATRMHRSLIDYASGSPDVALENLERGSGVAFSKSKPTRALSTLPNRIEVAVHKSFEQYSTAQMNDHGSSNSTNEQMHEKPSVWGLGGDVQERSNM